MLLVVLVLLTIGITKKNFQQMAKLEINLQNKQRFLRYLEKPSEYRIKDATESLNSMLIKGYFCSKAKENISIIFFDDDHKLLIWEKLQNLSIPPKLESRTTTYFMKGGKIHLSDATLDSSIVNIMDLEHRTGKKWEINGLVFDERYFTKSQCKDASHKY